MTLPGLLRRLHERRLLVPLAVSGLAAVVLVQGAWQRHSAPVQVPAPAAPPSAPPSPEIGVTLEKAPLAYQGDYWLQLGRRAEPGLVLVGSAPGLRLGDGLVVTSTSVLQPGDGGLPELLAADPDLGLALFQTEPGEGGALPEAELSTLRPGALLAAVSLTSESGLRVAPAHLVSAPWGGELDLSVRFPEPQAAVLVDLDGRLVGFGTARPRGGLRWLTTAALAEAVERLRERPPCRAVLVGELPAEALARFGLKRGLLVERVRRAAFSSDPGLTGGDVLFEWGGQTVSSATDFARAYDRATRSGSVSFRVRRQGQTVSGRLRLPGRGCEPPPPALVELPAWGIWLRRSGTGSQAVWQVARVEPGRGAAAGLRPGDRPVALDLRPLEGQDWPAALTRAAVRPAALTVRRGESYALLWLDATAGTQ